MNKLTKVTSMDEKKWEEERYASTLTEAAGIKSDPKKLKMAKAGAKRMAKVKMEEAKAMKNIAKSAVKKKATKKK